MKAGYFLIADVLGFSNIVTNSTPEVLETRVDEWVSMARGGAAEARIREVMLVSDTVFAAVDETPDGLGRLVNYGRHLLEAGIAQSLPIRGAISHGEFQWGSLTYGPAVVAAHAIERAQDWIGIACSNQMPHVKEMWGFDRLVCYPAPLRSGPIRLCPVVSWNVPRFRALVGHMCRGGLTQEEDLVPWEWERKLTNTALFGTYCRLLAQAKGSPEYFHGLFPMDEIDYHLFGRADETVAS